MRADDWIVDFLVRHGVTDIFGIPGVVVMDFLYAFDKRKPEITPHLTYHEQGGAFAACGYAQATGKLGVAYSTRGPGLTNMVTAIADAYYDSIPTMFITAHSSVNVNAEMRVLNNQEIDTVSIVQSVTKKAVRIDYIEELQQEVILAYKEAVSGRKGPVFLDIYNGLFSKDVDASFDQCMDAFSEVDDLHEMVSDVESRISRAKRPVFLIGNGARSEKCKEYLVSIAEKFSIPVLSSRGAQDIVPFMDKYYGFVGSRATRYSNFILSKADLILAVGNRMAFPVNSKSFWPIVEKAFTIRIDIDNGEFNREIPNSVIYNFEAECALEKLENANLEYLGCDDWINTCNILKKHLDKWDEDLVVKAVEDIISKTTEKMPLVVDVGNHSFWITTAHAYLHANNRILYSGSFGTLGSALPKSIGAYYSTREPVVCFTGDQGIQFNIQELQLISLEKLPITVVIVNNTSSGMIMEREIAKYGKYLVHTTMDSGYSFPNFEKVAHCYGLEYKRIDVNANNKDMELDFLKPSIIELMVDKDTELKPSLPVGSVCQDLHPELPRELYKYLNSL